MNLVDTRSVGPGHRITRGPGPTAVVALLLAVLCPALVQVAPAPSPAAPVGAVTTGTVEVVDTTGATSRVVAVQVDVVSGVGRAPAARRYARLVARVVPRLVRATGGTGLRHLVVGLAQGATGPGGAWCPAVPTLRGVPSGLAGYTTGTGSTQCVVVDVAASAGTGWAVRRFVLAHELVHAVLRPWATTATTSPAWVQEGVADLLALRVTGVDAQLVDGAGAVRLAAQARDLALASHRPRWSQLEPADADFSGDAATAARAYAAAWAFAEAVAQRCGADAAVGLAVQFTSAGAASGLPAPGSGSGPGVGAVRPGPAASVSEALRRVCPDGTVTVDQVWHDAAEVAGRLAGPA